MLIKQGDGKVLKVISEDEILDIDSKKVAKVFQLHSVKENKTEETVKSEK
jgi:hypothetical protein